MLRAWRSTVLSSCVAAAVLASAGGAIDAGEVGRPARLHLPQLPVRTVIEGDGHRLLSRFFRDAARERPGAPLPREVETLLLDALPAPYDNACRELAEVWGLGARGVPSMRFLAGHAGPAESRRRVLLAFRCGCGPEIFGKEYIDERLVALGIGADRSALAVIPHDPDVDRDSNLSRIGIPATMRVGDGPAWDVPIETSSENPCCDGPYSLREMKTFLLIPAADGFDPAGEILISREEYDHDDVDGDTTTKFKADAGAVRDPLGNVVRIVSNYRVTRTDEESGRVETIEAGKKEFAFDPKARRFVPAP